LSWSVVSIMDNVMHADDHLLMMSASVRGIAISVEMHYTSVNNKSSLQCFLQLSCWYQKADTSIVLCLPWRYLLLHTACKLRHVLTRVWGAFRDGVNVHWRLQGKASRDGCDEVRRVCATVRMVARWGGGSRIEQLGRIWRFGDLEGIWRRFGDGVEGGERKSVVISSIVATCLWSHSYRTLNLCRDVSGDVSPHTECTWTGKSML
jgi:hypothetical protein